MSHDQAVANLRSAIHPKIMELIIFPTEKCNFRCTYCYETFEVGKMKRPTIEGIKNLLAARTERKTLDHLVLSWFGGEPTLAVEIMYELSEYANGMVADGRLKSVQGSTTTNGYLLNDAMLRKLVGLKQNTFQISLDGWGEGHDATRRYASGKGTFHKIWPNLLNAHNSDLEFNITLRLHQTALNGESMDRLIDEIRANLKGDKRFPIFFKTIENLGGPNSGSISKMEVSDASTRVRRYAQALKADGFNVSAVLDGPESSKGDLDIAGPGVVDHQVAAVAAPQSEFAHLKGFGGYICYASKPNSLVVRADGSIGKCTVMLEDARNRVGVLRTDGTVKLDDEKMKLWMRGFGSFDPMELGCPAQNLPKLASAEQPLIPMGNAAKVMKLDQLEAAAG